jgi:competence protein ComEC
MSEQVIHFWKRSPFIRLLIPFIAGILLQQQFGLPFSLSLITGFCFLLILAGFFLLPFFRRYQLSFINGLVISGLFICLGSLLTFKNDIRHSKEWFGHFYKSNMPLVVTLNEPPVEKARSLKTEANVLYMLEGSKTIPVKGKIILYFKKEIGRDKLVYGSGILLKKSLQDIRNSGNPGSFDYKQYSLFHGITHQVYLQENEFVLLERKDGSWWMEWIYSIREKILRVLRKNISTPKELGLAEALLIGYKDDLDKSLVQSYSNTGVVHIIAISGLHLGLIYWLLIKLLHPLKKQKKLKWLSPVLVITGLWLFSLLAGAQPSVLRSALMFTCIVAGESITRKTNIYNTLAFSAFILLCYNPYWLWDVGFQLSYTAVLSIVIFMQPVYHLFYIKNKMLDLAWKLNAVTLAAQALTIPFTTYYFKQFPNYFLLTNFLAVPLSSIILIGEILLCIIAFIPTVALVTGKALAWLIMVMNTYVERIESIPFSRWNGLYINFAQAVLLLFFIAGIAWWLMGRSKNGLRACLLALLGFAVFRSLSFIRTGKQQRIIVYNISQKRAIDFIEGRYYFFKGDADLQEDVLTRNFFLSPSRILHRASPMEAISGLWHSGNYISWNDKHILLVDNLLTLTGFAGMQKQVIDLLVISKSPAIRLQQLAVSLDIRQVIFDGSVPSWKVNVMKKDCDELHIPFHDVTVKGAFAMNLQ